MPSTYAFDPTGLAAANKIIGEVHTLTEINANPYRLIIPGFAPFYLDNFKLSYIDSLGATQVLVEGIDFHLTLPYIAATRSIGKMIYGGISISNLKLNGTYKVDYQTIGGDWVCDVPSVFQALVNNNYNPKIASWDSVTNVQAIFPPINHEVHMDQLKGHEDLIASLGTLASTIANKPQTMWPLPASQAQVNTGLDNKTYVTPLTLKNAIGVGSGGGGGVAAPHTHAEEDIVGLISDLSQKSDVGHLHSSSEITGLQTTLDSKASLVHSHSSIDITGLDTLLSTKANSTHGHDVNEISGLQTLLGSLQSQIDDITLALSNKASFNHTHTSSQITDIGNIGSSLGLNSVTNMTGQYSFGTDIVNNKGDMLLSVFGGLYTNNSINVYVDGKAATGMGNATGAYIYGSCFCFVPDGKTFRIDLVSGASAPNITTWTKQPVVISNIITETFDNANLPGWIKGQHRIGGTGASMTTVNGYVVAESYGSGPSWHGPRITKALPNTSDFDVTFEDFNFSNVALDMGDAVLAVGNSTKPDLFYFTMNDAWDNATAGLESYLFACLDQSQTLVTNRTSAETLSNANIRLVRSGSIFKGYLNGVEKLSTTCSTDAITEISIQFGQYTGYTVNEQKLGGVTGIFKYI